eukprot:gene20363-27128_t
MVTWCYAARCYTEGDDSLPPSQIFVLIPLLVPLVVGAKLQKSKAVADGCPEASAQSDCSRITDIRYVAYHRKRMTAFLPARYSYLNLPWWENPLGAKLQQVKIVKATAHGCEAARA